MFAYFIIYEMLLIPIIPNTQKQHKTKDGNDIMNNINRKENGKGFLFRLQMSCMILGT